MTRPEPAGAGTAEIEALLAAIDAEFPPAPIHSLRAAITAAITAAESRATERCAKIAERFPPTVMPRPGILLAATFSDIAEAIRSSISPPGDT